MASIVFSRVLMKHLCPDDALSLILSNENPVRKRFAPPGVARAGGAGHRAAGSGGRYRCTGQRRIGRPGCDRRGHPHHPPSARAGLACAAARTRPCRLDGRMEGAARDMHGRRARTPDRRPPAGTPPVFRPARKVRESSDRDTVRPQFHRRLSGASIPRGQAVSMRPGGTVMAPFLPVSGGRSIGEVLVGQVSLRRSIERWKYP